MNLVKKWSKAPKPASFWRETTNRILFPTTTPMRLAAMQKKKVAKLMLLPKRRQLREGGNCFPSKEPTQILLGGLLRGRWRRTRTSTKSIKLVHPPTHTPIISSPVFPALPFFSPPGFSLGRWRVNIERYFVIKGNTVFANHGIGWMYMKEE